MGEKRRQFTKEFKLEAVGLAESSGKPLARVARELGIRADMLRTWKRQLESAGEEAFPGNGNVASTEEENRRLRRELEVVRQERDFLKKAAAYFAKESR